MPWSLETLVIPQFLWSLLFLILTSFYSESPSAFHLLLLSPDWILHSFRIQLNITSPGRPCIIFHKPIADKCACLSVLLVSPIKHRADNTTLKSSKTFDSFPWLTYHKGKGGDLFLCTLYSMVIHGRCSNI